MELAGRVGVKNRSEELRSATFVPMMEATHLANRDDLSGGDWFDRSRVGRVFAQSEMGPAPMVIVDMSRQDTTQLRRVDHDHVVQTLAAEGADQSLHIRVLPRARRTRDHLADTHASDSALECVTIDRIAVSQQPSRCRIVRTRLNDLLGRPCRRRMLGDVEMNNPPAVVRQHDEDEEDSAGEGGDGEEIDRHQRGGVIGQKGPPRL